MVEHTPGPWRIRSEGYVVGVYTITIESIAGPLIGQVWASKRKQHDDATPAEESKANALLITAAPALLAEMRRLHAKHGEQQTADILATAAPLALASA